MLAGLGRQEHRRENIIVYVKMSRLASHNSHDKFFIFFPRSHSLFCFLRDSLSFLLHVVVVLLPPSKGPNKCNNKCDQYYIPPAHYYSRSLRLTPASRRPVLHRQRG